MRSRSRGFSMVELLISLTLTLVLAMSVANLWSGAEARKQAKQLEHEIQELTEALFSYYLEHENYPSFSGGAVPASLKPFLANLKEISLLEVQPAGEGVRVRVAVSNKLRKALDMVSRGSLKLVGWSAGDGGLAGYLFPVETSKMARVEMGVGKRYGSDDLHNRRFLVDPSRRVY